MTHRILHFGSRGPVRTCSWDGCSTKATERHEFTTDGGDSYVTFSCTQHAYIVGGWVRGFLAARSLTTLVRGRKNDKVVGWLETDSRTVLGAAVKQPPRKRDVPVGYHRSTESQACPVPNCTYVRAKGQPACPEHIAAYRTGQRA